MEKMNKHISDYITEISKIYSTGNATEHSYRGSLQTLIKNIVPDVIVTNEPKQQKCGAPDYLIQNEKSEVPVAYIEAKDIKPHLLDGLDNGDNNNQLKRYVIALDNVMTTDYIEFRLYKRNESNKDYKVEKLITLKIAEVVDNKIQPLPENYDAFAALLKDFCSYHGISIKSAKKLAKMMAVKAQLLRDVILETITGDDAKKSSLYNQFTNFKEMLIKGLDKEAFAGIYAQTIAYGLFAARLHDKTLEDFSRYEAMELMPRSNPFLRHLFEYVGGTNLDDRVVWIVDALVDVFRACNIEEILKDFGKSTKQEDPMIHFYETFLKVYNPIEKIERGVFYTPKPVVKFIVRAVDDILKNEFDVVDGIIDTSKIEIKVDNPHGPKKIKKEVHKIQILDPATGTGTFLCEVIKHIEGVIKKVNPGSWTKYVDEDLMPRLNGFELLLAPYAMCHLKIEMLLESTGYKTPDKERKRLNVFLTNSLEPEHEYAGLSLFGAEWLAEEANDADIVKKDTPVMIVMGNPPYAVSSSNKSEWIQNLLKDYKKDLNERNIQPLSDDYIKFIRYGESIIEKNEEGILAFISNNSFIDGIIHRQMRKHLLETFDKIYILDLHGNSKKKEKAPDGSPDNNVFDIMQGVSINIFIKKKRKNNNLAQVFHCDLYGKRKLKYDYLNKNFLKSIKWNKLENRKPEFFFVKKDWKIEGMYSKGIRVNSLFKESNAGLATEFDSFSIKNTKKEANNLLNDLNNISATAIIEKYKLDLAKINKVENAINDIKTNKPIITSIDYRPFDTKHTIYTGVSNGIMGRPRNGIMKHMLNSNIALLTCRQQTSFDFQHIFISTKISERCSVSLQTGEVNYIYPLYLLNDTKDNLIDGQAERTPNLDEEIVAQFAEKLALQFTNEKEEDDATFAPIDILDYIYGILHSPNYRDKFKEFLKIDFPRVPYPEDMDFFFNFAKLGSELRKLHLMEGIGMTQIITQFPIEGDAEVEKPNFELDKDNCELGKVWINKEQYFAKVPKIAWEF